MDFPTIINWVNSFLGVLGVIFILSDFTMKFLCANRIASDMTLRSAAAHRGLYCLPMSHEKDAMLKCVRVREYTCIFSGHKCTVRNISKTHVQCPIKECIYENMLLFKSKCTLPLRTKLRFNFSSFLLQCFFI